MLAANEELTRRLETDEKMSKSNKIGVDCREKGARGRWRKKKRTINSERGIEK